jgi:hemerythrin superfamily protein
MNAIELLKADHDRVEGLFEKFKQDETGSHGALFKQINGELETHTHIEETIFYPAAMKSGKADLKKIIREGLEEHAQVKALLAELSEMTARSTQFNAKLKVVVEDVEHHVEEEEGEMFPLCEDQMSDAQLEKLGAEMEAEKKRFQKANRIKPAPEPKPKGIGAMVGRAVAAVEGVLGGSTKPRKAARGGKGKRSGANGKGRAQSRSNGKPNGKPSRKTSSSSRKSSASKGSSARKGAAAKTKTATRKRASAGK